MISNKISNFRHMPSFYDNPADMEPLLPADPAGELAALGWNIVRHAERLGTALHPITAHGLVAVVQVMNSYYSHLIEGHGTKPADLEAVLRQKPEGSSDRRDLQQLHFAHLAVQEKMTADLQSHPDRSIVDAPFLQDLHRHFINALPASATRITEADGSLHPIIPGAWRTSPVQIGRHLASAHEKLPDFVARFARFYHPLVNDTGPSLVACAAAHHRLVWIHPWDDANGRVARLFTQAWLIRARVHAHGLWSISRGLARSLTGYRAALANADAKRHNDFDGRGYLSQSALHDFCRFFLQTCLDQLDYMAQCLAIDTLDRRLTGLATLRESTGDYPPGTARILRQAALLGELPRGEIARIIGKKTRTAQTTIQQLLALGPLTSPTPKGPLRLAWPADLRNACLPNLFDLH